MIDFELIVPEGWVHIPTTPESARLRARLIEDIIRQRLPDSLPRDKAGPWRRMVRRELTESTDEAGRNGAHAVVMPVDGFNGIQLPGSMLLSVLDDSAEPADPAAMLASIVAAAGPEGMALEIGGAPAARVQSIVESDRIGRKDPSIRVNYYVSHPDLPGVWGLLTFTVLTDGDVDAEPVQAVVLLFDAIVASLRWDDRFDVPTEDEVLALLDPEPSS